MKLTQNYKFHGDRQSIYFHFKSKVFIKRNGFRYSYMSIGTFDYNLKTKQISKVPYETNK